MLCKCAKVIRASYYKWLNRNFVANNPNEKWLTDVTKFKLTTGSKAYLSAILDLCDNIIISYVHDRSNNKLFFDTLDKAIESNPTTTPLFYSDRGFQYTSKAFKYKLNEINAIQSISRVGRYVLIMDLWRLFGVP